MAAGRVIASFNIKDKDVQAIHEEILKAGRGLLSEICCAALRQWKGSNLTIEETKQRLFELEKQDAQIQLQKKSLQIHLDNLEKSPLIQQEEEQKDATERNEERKLQIRKTKETINLFFDLPEETVKQYAEEWVDITLNPSIFKRLEIASVMGYLESKGFKRKEFK